MVKKEAQTIFPVMWFWLILSRDNPLGMKGNIAKDYGDLIRDIWKGKSRTIAPLRLRVFSLCIVCI